MMAIGLMHPIHTAFSLLFKNDLEGCDLYFSMSSIKNTPF